MNENFTEKMLNIKIEQSKESLMNRIDILKSILEIELHLLNEREEYYPNEFGIIKSLGQEIDVLCGNLGALRQMKEIIESENKNN